MARKREPFVAYYIRTKAVGKYPPNVMCPFQAGCLMGEYRSAYSNNALRTVYSVRDATAYETPELAQAAIKACGGYAAEFEVIELVEVIK